MTELEMYMNAIVLLRKLMAENIISDADFIKAEKFFAKKYNIKKRSVFRPTRET